MPVENEILVKVLAMTVASGDVRVRTLKLPRGFGLIGNPVLGITRPRQPILGTDLAGTVDAIGKNVTAFKPGDAVIGFSGAVLGCHAECRILPVSKPIVLKPVNLSFDEATSLPFGGMIAKAHAYVETGRKRGSVLVRMAQGCHG